MTATVAYSAPTTPVRQRRTVGTPAEVEPENASSAMAVGGRMDGRVRGLVYTYARSPDPGSRGVPSPYLIGLEAVMLALFLVCLRHAVRDGAPAVSLLVAGVLFGLLLEWATIQQLQAYSYGRYLAMLGDVPLAIGVGWGTIIYGARLFSDRTSLPAWARPVLDGLLALNVDLAMDATAIRLGMWDWGRGLAFEYLGVPWANFWAWFWVVASFSAGVRLLGWHGSHARRALAPFGAIALGVAGVLGTNHLITRVVPRPLQLLTVAATLGAALLLVAALRPRAVSGRPGAPAWVVPLGLHLYFLAAGVASGVIVQPPVLLAVSTAMLLVAAVLHRRAVRAALVSPGAAGPGTGGARGAPTAPDHPRPGLD